MNELRLERLSWPEIEGLISSGVRTVVVVVAASEQHGPHLPEGTDAFLGDELGVRVAHKLGDALVAPVIRPGLSQHHMPFAGTITITEELLFGLLDSYISSLAGHGFQQFVVFSSHGGNYGALQAWQAERRDPRVRVFAEMDMATAALLQPLRKFGRSDTTIPHADVTETAEMLVVAPDLVHMERAEVGYTGQIDGPTVIARGMRSVSANGILGDPRGATAEMGEAVLESLASLIAGHVRRGDG